MQDLTNTKTENKLFIAAISLIIFCAWTIKHPGDIKKAEWLIGTWENKTPKGSIYETWSKEHDNEFSGKNYIVNGKDTLVFETIRLVQEQDGLYYIPTVKGQNNNSPVRFSTKTILEDQLVFENPEHDFPQIISYTRITADSLVAQISGSKNGQKREQAFPMKRVK